MSRGIGQRQNGVFGRVLRRNAPGVLPPDAGLSQATTMADTTTHRQSEPARQSCTARNQQQPDGFDTTRTIDGEMTNQDGDVVFAGNIKFLFKRKE